MKWNLILLTLFFSASIGELASASNDTKEESQCKTPRTCQHTRANDAVTTTEGVKIYWDLVDKDQNDPDLIKAIRDVVLIPPDKMPLNLTRGTSMKNLNGQFGQPKTVESILKKRWSKRKWKSKIGKGFFVEAGASEGEHISNTLYFELNYKWTGLLVEPNPDFIPLLKLKHRNAWFLPHCLSTERRVQIVDFDADLFNGGIIQPGRTLPSELGEPVPRDESLPPRRTIKVQCFPLYSILMALGNPTVDYFSLDIEGAELAVLKTIPWAQVKFEAIGIEVVHAGEVFDGGKHEAVEFLAENDFDFVETSGHDEIFVKRSKPLKRSKSKN